MTWRTFGRTLALALIGQAVVRMALTDATDTPANLFWSGIALAVTMMLISFILNVIAAVREAGRSRQDCRNRPSRQQCQTAPLAMDSKGAAR